MPIKPSVNCGSRLPKIKFTTIRAMAANSWIHTIRRFTVNILFNKLSHNLHPLALHLNWLFLVSWRADEKPDLAKRREAMIGLFLSDINIFRSPIIRSTKSFLLSKIPQGLCHAWVMIDDECYDVLIIICSVCGLMIGKNLFSIQL
jgi:hypothetical protein